MKLFALFLSLYLLACSGRELHRVGEGRPSSETYYYGSKYSIKAYKVFSDDLNDLKKELKNDLSSKPSNKDSKKQWDEISSLSTKDYEFFLLELIPETRVPQEFLTFKFELDGEIPAKTWSYYVLQWSAKVRSNRPILYPVIATGPYPGSYVYPLTTNVYESSVEAETEHTYRFLLTYPRSKLNRGRKLRVVSPQDTIYEFEVKAD
ncbi:hypothetical protein CH373_09010 [Leptospira perolatii]|uniref:Uncharacterized protein n=1 Tax=Leptospira perolatii TaxID=2023191 RepID=A0A2M9ZNG3_9LEPT|nr:hypothetical protein [Leptospira perolatii]PJZ69633.1 hypothetical protein CH360_10155 [Leptospira perolatii]PJZ73620.1 hypothetical protein CH373_09010 [Leptospira perolatii]